MRAADATLCLFTLFGGLRIVSYIPQILRIARDRDGAGAISYATWMLWIGANASTAMYASVNLGDAWLAFVSWIYAACCLAVILITARKRYLRHRRSFARTDRPYPHPRAWLHSPVCDDPIR